MPNANARNVQRDRGKRDRAVRAALFAAGLAGVTFLLVSAHVPCGFARIFHMPCPGCGSTRAMLALVSGDLNGWLRYNPFAPFMTALVVALALQAFTALLETGTFRGVGDGRMGMVVSRGVLVVGALQVILWVARFGGFLGGPVPV